MVDERKGRAARRGLRVLVVDDNRAAADTLALLLKLWGHETRVAYDGAAGLEAARQYLPDCLLLDIDMPRLDGYALARQVRQQPGLERATLVAVTAYSDEAHRQRAQEAGFDHHLTKPADPRRLEGILRGLNEVLRLARRAEQLSRQNAALANETQEVLREMKADIRDIKDEIREMREEIREARENATVVE